MKWLKELKKDFYNLDMDHKIGVLMTFPISFTIHYLDYKKILKPKKW